ncbi:bifunctional folylpolyglutamate synthase/dihydrofolate synthase [Desulfovibrio sp. OttesenSCG-928-A18]|nr:bifunctional folylpolyglutamate synthase/dihydrofolate synthase [Desulfovibrio sp. OttesenSCG-928-A18]
MVFMAFAGHWAYAAGMHGTTFLASPAGPADASSDDGAFFSRFPDLLAHLDRLGLFRMRPGLERMRAVLESLDLARPPCTVVQVVGTNGKGSVSTMLESLARRHGLRTGLHCSPHFVSVRERIRLNGELLPEAAWLAHANTLMRRGGQTLSYFEFVTCLAVLAFAEGQADIAVMESGLGGSFDATTALEADLVLFTPIGLDHQAVLGDSLAAIAADKAGAIRRGGLALSAWQCAEAGRILEEKAAERGATFRQLEHCAPGRSEATGGNPPAPEPRLQGPHQRENACLALAAWRCLVAERLLCAPALATVKKTEEECGSDSLEKQALAQAWLPGRLQAVPPLKAAAAQGTAAFVPCPQGWPAILLDGAHNSHGFAALGRALAQGGIAPAAVIFSCLADKDPASVVPLLRALATGPVFVPPIAKNPRAMPPEELAAMIGLNATPVASFKDALGAACAHMAERLPEVFSSACSRHPLLICGSLYMLGEFYALRPDCLTPDM